MLRSALLVLYGFDLDGIKFMLKKTCLHCHCRTMPCTSCPRECLKIAISGLKR